MTRPWEADPHYFARLATFAASLRAMTGKILAVYDIDAHVGGRVLDVPEIVGSLELLRADATGLVENQITIFADIHERDIDAAKLVLDDLFHRIERGARPAPPGALARHWSIRILPPYSAPVGWPERPQRGTDEWPNTFTFEFIVWPDDTDLGRIFVARWTDAPGGFLRFRDVSEE
jgi:hypothetical protein